jgi:hypothetical protein
VLQTLNVGEGNKELEAVMAGCNQVKVCVFEAVPNIALGMAAELSAGLGHTIKVQSLSHVFA